MKFQNAMARILKPLISAAIARGVTFPDLSNWLKALYIERAESDFGLDGKRMTDSRISLLTGLQRRDVSALRKAESLPVKSEGASALARVIAKWVADKPRRLSRTAFEELVSSVSRDMHPRTMLDELQRQGAVVVRDDAITLKSEGYLPEGDDGKLGYFGANLGDHAEAAAANLATAPAPYFERAVHYNQLTPASLSELDETARRLQTEALKTLNADAMRLQKRDAGAPDATGRFRCGGYVYMTEDVS